MIEISGLVAGDPAAVPAVAAQISAAMARSGFFYVAGHGIAATKIDAMRHVARGFFALDRAAKRSIAINSFNRGYLAPGQARMHGAAKTDLKEVFFWGRELAADDPDVRAGLPLCGPNQWPASPADFRVDVMDYFRAVCRIGDALLGAFASSLGRPADAFARHYLRPMARGQLIHYPALPDAADAAQFSVAPHTDFGCITLLLQETDGLEVLAADGAWIQVPPREGTLVVNIGDLMERWTAGRYPSTRHRVRNTTGRARFSTAVFYDPSPSAVVDPAEFAGRADPAHPPVEAANYIHGRNTGAFAHYAEPT